MCGSVKYRKKCIVYKCTKRNSPVHQSNDIALLNGPPVGVIGIGAEIVAELLKVPVRRLGQGLESVCRDSLVAQAGRLHGRLGDLPDKGGGQGGVLNVAAGDPGLLLSGAAMAIANDVLVGPGGDIAKRHAGLNLGDGLHLGVAEAGHGDKVAKVREAVVERDFFFLLLLLVVLLDITCCKISIRCVTLLLVVLEITLCQIAHLRIILLHITCGRVS